ncbi:hypothetical protein J2Z50_001722 [Ensifer mexicanus]|nr:hypothetical protein [Sinorhizobium mexicanum]
MKRWLAERLTAGFEIFPALALYHVHPGTGRSGRNDNP